jgi:tetratricopeptide (TPR) repeat protein
MYVCVCVCVCVCVFVCVYFQSIESFHEALKLFESLEDDNGISVCFENLGESYMKLGEIDGAIEAYERCLLIKTELWDKVGQAQCLDALGLAYYSKGDFKGAAQCYEKSITLWRAEGDKSALMACCEALGGANFQLGEHVRSIECYVQFLTLSHEVGEGGAISQDIGDGAQILLRLGISNSAIGEYPVSIEFLDQALSYYVELGDIKSRAVCLQHLGAAKGRNGNFEGGIKDLEQVRFNRFRCK